LYALQYLTELEYSGVNRNKEQSGRMLGHLISKAPQLIRPYMQPILAVLIPKLKEPDQNLGVVVSILTAVGDIALVCQFVLHLRFVVLILATSYVYIPTLSFSVFVLHAHSHTYPFNGPFFRTTRVSQKGKAVWILLEQETMTGSGISWAICKSAPRSGQITMPAPHHSVFYTLDAIPAAQPTVSKH